MYEQKYHKLLEILKSYKKAAVALSGGIDSTLLAYATKEALWDNAHAVTVIMPYIPSWEERDAREIAGIIGISHQCLEIAIPPEIMNNSQDRCYQCKKAVFLRMRELLGPEDHIVEGSNVDDKSFHRPGMRALQELSIASPLLEAGLTKNEIRLLSREKGLANWNKPSNACLLTRFPYGTTVDKQKLKQVEEAERILSHQGLRNVRVRVHGDLARIEVDRQSGARIWEQAVSDLIVRELTELGFSHLTLDLKGFRSGSFDE